jgi:hypothetical protein
LLVDGLKAGTREVKLVTVAFAIAVLAGCGSSSSDLASKSPSQILAATEAATNEASAVHLFGTIAQDGGIGIDLHFAGGKGGYGYITEHGGKLDIVQVGNETYLRASGSFWKGQHVPAVVAALLQHKWFKISKGNSQPFQDLTSFTNLHAFFKAVFASHGSLSKTNPTNIDGHKVIGLNDNSNDPSTLYIATTGRPYPVSITSSTGQGSITFDHWNKPVRVVAPAGAIDISKLIG